MEVILKYYSLEEIKSMFRRLEKYGLYSADNKNSGAVTISTDKNN